MATSGVIESLAPSRLACSTPPSSAAGNESERIVTYSTAGPSSAGSDAKALPTYRRSTGTAATPHSSVSPMPHISPTCAAHRTTHSLSCVPVGEPSSRAIAEA